MIKQKGFAGIAVLIILALGALGFGAYKVSNKKVVVEEDSNLPMENLPTDLKPNGVEQKQVPVEKPAVKNTAKNSVAVSDEANWKTYRNEKYGFEFRYPNKYFLYDNQSRLDFNKGQPSLSLEKYSQESKEGGDIMVLKIFHNPENLNVFDWLKKNGRDKTNWFSLTTDNKYGFEDYKTFSFGGESGIVLSLQSSGIYENSKKKEVILGKDSLIFVFQSGHFFSEDKEAIENLDELLLTFKFLQSPTYLKEQNRLILDTYNWDTFTNSTYMYSFRFPPGSSSVTSNVLRDTGHVSWLLPLTVPREKSSKFFRINVKDLSPDSCNNVENNLNSGKKIIIQDKGYSIYDDYAAGGTESVGWMRNYITTHDCKEYSMSLYLTGARYSDSGKIITQTFDIERESEIIEKILFTFKFTK